MVYDRLNGAPPPTFYRHNWADHANDDSTSGKTRIDTFLVNASAAHVNHDVQYCYLEAASFDHIPIAISSYLQAFNDTIVVATQPAKLSVRNLQSLSVKHRAALIDD